MGTRTRAARRFARLLTLVPFVGACSATPIEGGEAPPAISTRSAALSPATSTPSYDFDVGQGVWDITGPVAENQFAGYAAPGQTGAGLDLRLYARAFVIATPLTTAASKGKRVAIVEVELNAVSQAVRSAVLDKLASLTDSAGNPYYTDENLMIGATHHHTGPGGYHKLALYDGYEAGFQQQTFDAIVDGVYQAVLMAHGNLRQACIRRRSGKLEGQSPQDHANTNRSPAAMAADPEYGTVFGPAGSPTGLPDTNKLMTVLKFQAVSSAGKDNFVCNGAELGMLDWFAVHGTSLGGEHVHVSSDNKGMAAYYMERAKGVTYDASHPDTFVAAFANADEGDASPNVCDYKTRDGCGRRGGAPNDYEDASVSGAKQYLQAWSLYAATTDADRLTNQLDYRHAYVDMSAVWVDPKWTAPRAYTNGAGLPTTCAGAIGFSFAAGAEDGPTNLPGFSEGMRYGGPFAFDTLLKSYEMFLGSGALNAIFGVSSLPAFASDACQYPKPVLLQTGYAGWTPHVLPVQLFRVGRLAIVGVPGEMTTVAGYRLRNTVLAQLAPAGVDQVVIMGLANAYAGYVTTPEEYDQQHYEGASTHFGRMTFPAYQQLFGTLAQDMAAGSSTLRSLPRPADKCGTSTTLPCIDLQPGVVTDSHPRLRRSAPTSTPYGFVRQDASSTRTYHRGDFVDVYFQAGHPKNDPKLNRADSFATVRVEDCGAGCFHDLYEDAHPSLVVSWFRDHGYFAKPDDDTGAVLGTPAWFTVGEDDGALCAGCNYVRVRWQIPVGAAFGKYRIAHRGKFKADVADAIEYGVATGSLNDYRGESTTFVVGP